MKIEGLQHFYRMMKSELSGAAILKDLAEVIAPIVDSKGSLLAGVPNIVEATGAAGYTEVDTPTAIADDKMWWIPIFNFWHDDSTSRYLTPYIKYRTTLGVRKAYVRDSAYMTSNEYGLVNRVFVAPAYCTLGVEANALGGGNTLCLRIIYYEIDPGDYTFPF